MLSNNNELIFSISFLISNLWLSSCLIFEDCEKIKLQKKNNKKCEIIFINFKNSNLSIYQLVPVLPNPLDDLSVLSSDDEFSKLTFTILAKTSCAILSDGFIS